MDDPTTEKALRDLGCSPALRAQFEQACRRQGTAPDIVAWQLIHDYAETHNPLTEKVYDGLRRLR